jgi:flagellar biosynthesis protein FlhF
VALEIFTGTHLPTLLSTIRTALGPDACVVQLRRKGATYELIASDVPGQSPFGSGTPVSPPTVEEPRRPDPRPTTVRSAPPPAQSAERAEWGPPARSAAMPPAPTPAQSPRPSAHAAPEFHEVFAQELRDPARPRDEELPARPEFMPRPWFVALVGPTGAGKTTTIAKLATSAQGFAGCRVGLLGLDTYRVGAAEQLGTYAELGDLPCEIVYSDADLPGALKRLASCEVVLIDTPGRGPRNIDDAEIVRNWLTAIAPDEVHLTLPAGQLAAVSRRLLRAFASFRCTHLLATKLDEYPIEHGIFDLAIEHAHPMRWITDGQEVPADLRPAGDLLGAARERRRAMTRDLEPVT